MRDDLLPRLQRRDRRALSRLLSLAADNEQRSEIDRALTSLSQYPSRVIAFTGSAGVGKSTLVGKLIEKARSDGKTVAILACDPQSPLTGGALLGDRFRMGAQPDDGIFIRSLATPGGSEAIVPHLPTLIRLLRVYGFDLIFLETVGAGQTDTAVSRLADLVVLLLQPESGDDLQWEKAGVLEVADVIVVHKADLPGAERTLGQVKATLEFSPQQDIPVLAASSQTKQGLDSLYQALWTTTSRRQNASRRDLAQMLRNEFEVRLRRAMATDAFRHLESHRHGETGSEEKLLAALWQLLG